jgi:transcriptional regulator with XRE-family HTH domain
MASIRASEEGIKRFKQARDLKGWNQYADSLTTRIGVSLSTVKRFEKGNPIRQDSFIDLCKAVGIENWEAIVDDSPLPQTDFRPEFSQYDAAWVGRDQLVAELSEKLQRSCRLLILLGITGIGKTALAERLAVELQDWFSEDWKNKFKRANFDYEDKANDFASVAARWLEEWGERLSPEEKKPELLLYRLVKHLRENQVLVLIDSLERLLIGNVEDGWGDFADEWWKKFFLSLLSAESCQSRLIVTSQDLPVKLVDSRYKNFWYREVLYGLEELEQVALFETTGLDVREDSPDKPLLLRIGKAYKGHPLVLRVIIGEISSEPFSGNVQAYWNDCADKIEEVEKALSEAEQGTTLGEEDNWKLHTLTKELRRQVNKRLEAAFDRLKGDVFDAYVLVCAASVYRSPEKEAYWLKHLTQWLKRLENKECSEERQEKALEDLSNRFLVEESINHNNRRVLGQHNLVRSVATDHRKKLLESLKTRA